MPPTDPDRDARDRRLRAPHASSTSATTGHQVIALVTQPDRPQGRKQELIPSPIKRAAIGRGIPVEQPENVNAPEALDRIRALAPDLLVTAAYGQILSAGAAEPPPAGGDQPARLDLARLPGGGPGGACDRERGARDGRHRDPHDPPDRRRGDDRLRRDADRPRRDGRRARRPPRPAGGPARRAGDRRPRRRPRAHPPPGEVPGHQGPEAPQGGRGDRLVGDQLAVHNRVRAMQPWPTASTFWHRRDLPPRRRRSA